MKAPKTYPTMPRPQYAPMNIQQRLQAQKEQETRELLEHLISQQGRDTRIPVKRIAVQKAHANLCYLLEHLKIPFVKKTFGLRILRVCCRTVVQLDNIPTMIQGIHIHNLIEEIGMPLDYEYKMKSLVLFIKAKDVTASKKIEYAIRESACNYHVTIVDSPDPAEQHALIRQEISNILQMHKFESQNTHKIESQNIDNIETSKILPVEEGSLILENTIINPMEFGTKYTNIYYKENCGEPEKVGQLDKLWYNLTVLATLISFLMLFTEFSRN